VTSRTLSGSTGNIMFLALSLTNVYLCSGNRSCLKWNCGGYWKHPETGN